MFVQRTVRTGYVIHIRSLLVSRPTLFFEVEVLASPVKSDLSGYGYVLPRQAHCETAQLSLREAHCETAPANYTISALYICCCQRPRQMLGPDRALSRRCGLPKL